MFESDPLRADMGPALVGRGDIMVYIAGMQRESSEIAVIAVKA